ncbi:hypothetical protein G7054_g2023 [Neopestalotiopsis clavispora]|nr:hypothetical protein G7054_g2023 [Neopestalotiopsis clavispora]
MQPVRTYLSLLALSAAVLALPVTEQNTDLILVSKNTGVEPVTTVIEPFTGLVIRDDCSTINAVIDKIGTSTEIAAYFSTGYYSALWVCQRVRGANCSDLAMAIASLFVSIAFIIGRASGASSLGTREDLSLAGYLEAAMSADGEVFDAVEDLTSTLAARDNSTGGAVEVATVRNWVYEGTPVSFDIHDFGDGNGHIILPVENIGVNATNLAKRGSGHAPGFKVSYTTRLESQLTRSHRADMANALANDWASRANSNSKLSNYIGLWKTDHNANFYFRIIPESTDFGMNYESVDVCGGMAGFL